MSNKASHTHSFDASCEKGKCKLHSVSPLVQKRIFPVLQNMSVPLSVLSLSFCCSIPLSGSLFVTLGLIFLHNTCLPLLFTECQILLHCCCKKHTRLSKSCRQWTKDTNPLVKTSCTLYEILHCSNNTVPFYTFYPKWLGAKLPSQSISNYGGPNLT